MNSFTKTLTAMALIASGGSGVMAATTTGLMPVTGQTLAACIVAATPMAFGTLNLLGATPNDSTAVVTVTCTPGTAYNVGLDNGQNFATASRHMKSATTAAVVPYALYSDTTRATPWGQTIGTNTVPGTATVVPTLLTVYGRVPSGTTPVAADLYLDTVTVTLTY